MSVPRSMQRMVTVPSGRGTLAMMKRRKGEISGMLLVSVYAMDFFKLSKMRRPGTGTQERKMVLYRGATFMYIDILLIPGYVSRFWMGYWLHTTMVYFEYHLFLML